MPADNVRTLRVLLDGDSAAFEVIAPANSSINHLKKLIQNERKLSVLRDVDPTVLVLWKLNEPLLIKPEKSLGERVSARGSDLSQFAIRLDSSDEVSEVFPEPVSTKHVHIIVWRPSAVRFVHLNSSLRTILPFISVTLNHPAPPSPPSNPVKRSRAVAPSSQAVPAQSQVRPETVESEDDGAGMVSQETPTHPTPKHGTKRKEVDGLSTGLRPVEGTCDRCSSFQVSRKCEIEEDWLKCRKCREDKQACYWGGITRGGARARNDERKLSTPKKKDDRVDTKRKAAPVELKRASPLQAKKSHVVVDLSMTSRNPRDKGKARAMTSSSAEDAEEAEKVKRERRVRGRPEDLARSAAPRSEGVQAVKALTRGGGKDDEKEGTLASTQVIEPEANVAGSVEPEAPVAGTGRNGIEEEELRPVEGTCDRCASFATPAQCDIGPGDLKCKKCRNDKQGCYWGDVTRLGMRRKKEGGKKAVGVKKATTKNKTVIAAPPPPAEPTGAVAGSSKPSPSARELRKGRATDADKMVSQEAVDEERAKLRARIMVLERLYHELD